MLFLVLILFQTPEPEPSLDLPVDENGIIGFYPEGVGDQPFTVSFQQREQRRFKIIARTLQDELGINLVVEASADVTIEGNFALVTVNEFLTFIVETYDLTVDRVGQIYRFRKPEVKAETLSLSYDETAGTLTIDAKKAAPAELARRLTEAWKTTVVPNSFNTEITGFVRDLPPMDALTALLRGYRMRPIDRESYIELTPFDPATDEPVPASSIEEPEEPLPALTFVDDRFSGFLEAASLEEALVGLARRARASLKLLDPLPEGSIGLYLEDHDFSEVLSKLFLGTAHSFKLIDDIYLIGLKSRPELTGSEMIIIAHMNAQNALAYLSGEPGLFQTYALPSRPANLGTFSGNSFGRFEERNRTFGANNRSGSFSNAPAADPSRDLQGSAVQDLSRSVSLSEEVAADITLIREHNALLVTGTQDVIEEIRERVALIDRPVPQVLIQALVVDYNTDSLDNYGISVSSGEFSYFPGLDLTLTGNRDAGGNWQIARLPSNFEVRLQAMASQGKARIISKPHIATLSGHEAYIEVGQTQYLLLSSETLIGNENPTARTTQRIETVEANISLRVIPWVTASGEITTYIEPIFNTFLGQVQENVPPPISTRRLQSTIRLANGETIILGGLIGEELRSTNTGLPGLSRIPILGYLFTNRDREFRKSELVIYLTPYVYYGDEGSVEIIRPRQGLEYPLDVREQQDLIKKKRRPWWRRKKKKNKVTPSPEPAKKEKEKGTPPEKEEEGGLSPLDL